MQEVDIPRAERAFQRGRPRQDLARGFNLVMANTLANGQEILRERLLLGERWGEMSRATEEAKKIAEEQRLKANTAQRKLKDAEIALKAEKFRHAAAAHSWEEAC